MADIGQIEFQPGSAFARGRCCVRSRCRRDSSALSPSCSTAVAYLLAWNGYELHGRRATAESQALTAGGGPHKGRGIATLEQQIENKGRELGVHSVGSI